MPPLESPRRSALAHHVHRPAQLGAWVLIRGSWYDPEGWGVWNDGSEAELAFALPPGWSGGGRLRLWLRGFAPLTGQREITLAIDGAAVPVTLRQGVEREVELPFAAGPGTISLSLSVPAPTRPVDAHIGEDRRQLGVALVALELLPP